MGGLLQVLPFSYIAIIIGSLALMGFPFLTGFYSKDVLLELAYSNYSFSGLFAFWLGLLSAGFTSFYSFRLIYLTFISGPNGFKNRIENIREVTFSLGLPIFVLSLLSLIAGFLTKEAFIGVGTCYWNNSIFTLPEHTFIVESEFIPIYVKWLPFLISIISACGAIFIYSHGIFFLISLYKTKLGYILYLFFNKKFFFDKLQNELICINLLRVGYESTYKVIDKGLIENIGPSGLAKLALAIGQNSKNTQSGLLNHYAFLIFIGLISIIYFASLGNLSNLFFDTRVIFLLSTTWLFLNN
jgi:NADH-ubiquinone oxidoreductase chain 5